MNASRLLVDPLAALFRTDLTGLPPLLLETTQVEVMRCRRWRTSLSSEHSQIRLTGWLKRS
jgi:hypothetical protein